MRSASARFEPPPPFTVSISSSRVKKVSLPSSPSRLSVPLPPSIVSLPLPAVTKSLPSPPSIRSLRLPPSIVSLPVSPRRRSLPSRPGIRSLPPPPIPVSAPLPPVTLSLPRPALISIPRTTRSLITTVSSPPSASIRMWLIPVRSKSRTRVLVLTRANLVPSLRERMSSVITSLLFVPRIRSVSVGVVVVDRNMRASSGSIGGQTGAVVGECILGDLREGDVFLGAAAIVAPADRLAYQNPALAVTVCGHRRPYLGRPHAGRYNPPQPWTSKRRSNRA